MNKIQAINKDIKTLSSEDNRRLNFSCWGIRTRRKRDSDGNQLNIPEHKYSDWQDEQHLNRYISQKVVNCVIKFIKFQLNDVAQKQISVSPLPVPIKPTVADQEKTCPIGEDTFCLCDSCHGCMLNSCICDSCRKCMLNCVCYET